jgi:hypothetical protein
LLIEHCPPSRSFRIHCGGNQLKYDRHIKKIPTGLIVTGPNIASQELLFSQLADRLRSKTEALVVILRSGDAANLKTVLKKLIRDATNGKCDDEDESENPQHEVSLSHSSSSKLIALEP